MFLYITLQKVGKKYLESLEIWCWGRMDSISWTDNVGNGRSITNSQGEEYPANSKKKEG